MISLIYPIKNRLNLFTVTIASILKYAINLRDKFEIIVIDSGSQDAIEPFCEVLRHFLDISYVEYAYPGLPGRHNPAYALNLGARLAKYKSIVFSSPEILHQTDVIQQLLPLVGKNVTCHVDNLNEDGSFHMELVSPKFRAHDPGMYFIGMFNKDDFWKIDGIDEQFMRGETWEDSDLGERFLRAGLKHEFHNEIVGKHQFHQRVHRSDKSWSVNKAHYENNRRNSVIHVNDGVVPGDPKYIVKKL